jgi:predicted CxxxxCH...CXXCH cytochrome family protein
MSTGNHTIHLSQGLGCVDCHNTTVSANNALIAGNTTHINRVADVGLAAGTYDHGAQSCSNTTCHSDGLGNFNTISWNQAVVPGAGTGCLGCHPNLTGSHAAHVGNLFSGGSVSFYNFTGNYSTGTMYRFGCSNCHPTDLANHRNGTVEVTLVADPAAGTLRSLNDPNATVGGIGVTGSGIAGTSKTSVVCSASYCHSNGYQDPNGGITYAASPDWYNPGSYTGDRCAMCHSNSPNSAIPGSAAHTVHVVGIHALNVFSGTFGNLTTGNGNNGTVSVGHGDPAQSTTLTCNMCHNNTVTMFRNDANNSCTGCHNNQGNLMQIANKAMHVTGHVDVAFANISVVSKAQLRPASFAAYSSKYWTRNGGNYKNGAAAFDTSKQTLQHAANWDGAGNCSNVACHMGQQVQWTNTNPPSYCALCHTAL